MYRVCLDCETALIRPGCQAPELAGVAVWAEGRGFLFDRKNWFSYVSEILCRPDVLIVGHSIAYDWLVLCNDRPEIIPAVFEAYSQDRVACTETRQKLLDIAAGVYRGYEDDEEEGTVKIDYSLEFQAWRILKRKLDKNTWRLSYGDLIPIPLEAWPEGAKLYPIGDVSATDGIFEAQEFHQAYLTDQFRQVRAAFWLKLMSAYGIHTDAQGVFELSERTQQDYAKIAQELRNAGLLRQDTIKRDGTIKPGSRDTKAARARMAEAFRLLGKPCPMTNPTRANPQGQIKLNEQACIDSGDAVLVQYARLTSLKTVLSKDIPALEGGIIFPIHSYFEVLRETGRTSSARPNIQNVRRLPGIRECFIPRLGMVFLHSDFGGLELCTLAQVCLRLLGFSRLADALNAGWDPHLLIASQILGWDYPTVKGIKDAGTGVQCVAGKVEGAKCNCDACRVDDSRQTGKVVNFGCPGGLGPDTLVSYALMNYGVRLTRSEAAELKKIWLTTWPEMKEYLRLVGKQTNAPFPVIKHLFSDRYRGGVNYTAACNSYFQGLGADIAKLAGWKIARACYSEPGSPLFGCRLVNFIHDEFALEVPEDRVHEASVEQPRLMLEAAKSFLPDVKIKVETVAMRRWSKKAKPIFNEGRLVPWG